jgi:hypothetical protein
MASRLYRSTRALYGQVLQALEQLELQCWGSPTAVVLLALYVTGLILLDVHQTQTRVTRFLPGRCHDALNRLLRVMPCSTRRLMALLVQWVKRQALGYLCLDDVIVEKTFARKLSWAGWCYSFAKKRQVYGLHIAVILWCSVDGRWRIPVAFRLWRPKRSCSPRSYRSKLQLAETMLKELVALGLPFRYIAFDTHYTAGWFTKMVKRLGCIWQGTLSPRTHVLWHGKKQSVSDLAARLHLKWRQQLGLRARALQVYAPKYGVLRLVVTRNRHGNYEYIASNDRQADLTTMVQRKHSRWEIETIFRDSKQLAGLGACQCWVDQAMVRHTAFVLLTFVILQMLQRDPHETVGAAKERWQLEVARYGQAPPPPLKACPCELGATA